MNTFLLAVLLFVSLVCSAQSPVGLWEVTRVTVGDKIVTPVGKWTRINADGTYQSGNGWQQNSEGNWSFDPKTAAYVPVEKNGIHDPYGGFRVIFDQDSSMLWHRDEDGAPVEVTWAPVKLIPRAPADLVVGVWKIDSIGTAATATAPVEMQIVFIRWDRIYVDWDRNNEKKYGYWFMNAHRPELTLMRLNGSEAEVWRVDVNEGRLTLTGMSDRNRASVRTFHKIDRLPE